MNTGTTLNAYGGLVPTEGVVALLGTFVGDRVHFPSFFRFMDSMWWDDLCALRHFFILGLTHSSDPKKLVKSGPAQFVETIHQKEKKAGCLEGVAQGGVTGEQWNAAPSGQFH